MNALLENFNPRSPHGERLLSLLTSVAGLPISIHALLTESDDDQRTGLRTGKISIHALLTESDCRSMFSRYLIQAFQSTLSSRRATPWDFVTAPL